MLDENTLHFPCTGQRLADFIGDIIKQETLIKFRFYNGYNIIHQYKDVHLKTNTIFPLSVDNLGEFSLTGISVNCPNGMLSSITIVDSWLDGTIQ